ncbi:MULTISPECIES: glutamate decarboxylase [Cryobacterium]|uniref:Glutamate decarboxylase n=1 Tax=Cryobacterium zongtaii TaxID=1259217 RepID=A0A2S3Z9G2_9MICO|nr:MULTISPECIES: glutamate decarboxylase [Cryobacterium]POH62180.1 glutamate decarboxylase [Cryobacterium zongtaii]POH67962.1 glutamate decarboxylase [Cryobacterium zongtaii]TFC47967.1 glutamate decarboxylase [Cryobacterium sp. TMN-39-2]
MSTNPEFTQINPLFARPGEDSRAPRHTLAAGPMGPETAYQIIHDEIMLDGNSRLNLATFVGTWMDDYARRLYAESFDKNMIDKDEYPQTAAIEDYCWHIIADLWHAPEPRATIGTSTIGSSEACMLGGLAFKRRWQQSRRAAGLPTDKPNLVMSSAVQVCWEKFCNYWEVEARLVPVTDEHPCLDGHDLAAYVDENTIGVVAIMGVTYTGIYEPVQEIAAALDAIQAATGLDVPIHVDAASGGMVAPFLQPELIWDFKLERVHSISTSAHKYGLVYPGLGWVVWRSRDLMPEELVFNVSYLGGDMPTLALNFSRPGAQVLLQYFLFLRLGFEGYRLVQQTSQNVALFLSSAIAEHGAFTLISDGSDIPVFAWSLKAGHTDKWNLYHLSDRLRARGWLVPAYPMPDNLSDQTVQRIVVRNGLSLDLASRLLTAITEETAYLDRLEGAMPAEKHHPGFTH